MRPAAPPDAAALADELRSRLGDPPALADPPCVSIVVLNRDGADYLPALLRGLAERTDYPALELIVVDNDSSDESVELVRNAPTPFPTATIRNDCNESFADACNQGAWRARGDLLLFLNNDTEPFEPGWLHELVACLRRPGVALAGATLLKRDGEGGRFAIQQRGAVIRDDGGTLRAAFRDEGASPLGDGLGVDVEVAAASGACLLIERELFDAVDGFTHGFMYGGEDSDLALKVREHGGRVVCSGRSFVIHATGATLDRVDRRTRAEWTAANRRLLWERWGPRLRRELEIDRIAGGGVWSEANGAGHDEEDAHVRMRRALAVGFCLRIPPAAAPDLVAQVDAVCAELARRGHCAVAVAAPASDDLAALECDIVVDVEPLPRKGLNRSRFNVHWRLGGEGDARSSDDPAVPDGYDLVFTGDPRRESAEALTDRLIADTLASMTAQGFPTRIDPEAAVEAPASPSPSLPPRPDLPPGPGLPPSRLAARWLTRPLDFLEDMRRQYGDLFTLRLPGEVPWVMVSDPELVRPILTAPVETLHAGEGNHALAPLMGPASIMLLDEERHTRQRRMLLPPFHGKRIAAYEQIMRDVAHSEIDRWPTGVAAPAWPRMQAIALEVILRTVFGADAPGRLGALRGAFESMLSYEPAGGPRAALLALNVPARLQETRFAAFRESIAAARGLVLDEVRRARGRPDRGQDDRVLSLLIDARYEDGSPPSDEELRDQLVTLVVAGHETTAMTLTWALERLVRHPLALERAAADAAGGDGAYIDATIKETLRLRPVIPILVRRVTAPLELGDHTIRTDASVVLNSLMLHRHPDLYPDPDAFEPERFLERQPSPHAWLPFGGGSRRCIGAGFALHEMEIVLRALLSRTRPRATDDEPERIRRRVIALEPSQGATVLLEPLSTDPGGAP